jgi:hypothetical protein
VTKDQLDKELDTLAITRGIVVGKTIEKKKITKKQYVRHAYTDVVAIVHHRLETEFLIKEGYSVTHVDDHGIWYEKEEAS